MKAVIFDLDQTVVDSSSIEPLRKAGRWRDVYARIPEVVAYEGVISLFRRLRLAGISTAIVTSSPSQYCASVLSGCALNVDACVCYHDTARKKPHPDPMLLALQKLGVLAENAVAVGDAPSDITSANAAGIYSIAATWGSFDVAALKAVAPDALVASVAELEAHLSRHFVLTPARASKHHSR